MENLSAALVGLMKSSFALWSSDSAGATTDALAIECSRARAEYERALATYVGVHASTARSTDSEGQGWDQAAETSVGDAPLVLPLTEARAVFDMLYVSGAVALFDGNHARAAKALDLDPARVMGCLTEVKERARINAELWSTVSALAQAGLEQG